MLREYFTNRWTIGGFLLLLLFAVFCHLWLRQETAKLQKQEAENAEGHRQLIDSEKVDTNSKVEQQAGDAPVESITSPSGKTAERIEAVSETGTTPNAAEDTVSTVTSETENTTGRVSPYGFGPYPEIPPGYPDPNIFDKPRSSITYELMMRVDVKLWQQGIRTEGIGISYKTGLVYPTIPGTIYVTWTDFRMPNGSVTRVAGSISGHSDTVDALPRRGLPGIPSSPSNFVFESDIPSHIRILEDSEGIDPYEFLNLKE